MINSNERKNVRKTRPQTKCEINKPLFLFSSSFVNTNCSHLETFALENMPKVKRVCCSAALKFKIILSILVSFGCCLVSI